MCGLPTQAGGRSWKDLVMQMLARSRVRTVSLVLALVGCAAGPAHAQFGFPSPDQNDLTVDAGTYNVVAWNEGTSSDPKPVTVPDGGNAELDFVLR